jgi:serine/threonine-protein kinase RsbT
LTALYPSVIPHGEATTIEIRIEREADIVAVRQRVRELAKDLQFDQFAVAALTTAASELSRNVWVHAKKGIARITLLRTAKTVGLELQFVDQGPGIADLNLALAGGFSTARSLGLGLSGTRRLADEFEIDSQLGSGTKVVIRKWKKEF